MDEASEARLLEFIRHEVVPLVLAQHSPDGLGAVIARFEREYPDLDLLERDVPRDRRAGVQQT